MIMPKRDDNKLVSKRPVKTPLTAIKAGQTVWLEVHGAGTCSYEEHTVEYVKKGQIKLEDLEHTLFDEKSLKSYGMFGFWFKILTEKPKGFK